MHDKVMIYTAILTLLVIMLCHYLYYYLQTTYTIPKIEKIYTIPEEHKHTS
jgi:hypothetical protein